MSGQVRTTHPEKVLWPEVGLTKADLRAYLEAAAPRMLPLLRGRPLSLVRHPAGVGRKGFLQKHLPDTAPAWLPRHEQFSPSSDRTVHYPLAGTLDDLVWMANQNAVEFHQALVRADRDDRPDLVVIDLDPAPDPSPDPTSDPTSDPTAAPTALVDAALLVREVLDTLGLAAAVKTSGKRGLHVVVPAERRWPHDRARAFGLALARATAARAPDRLTVAMRKADREGRLLLDWSRNGSAQTLAAAWSPRATLTATVSVPLRWDEVVPGLDPSRWTVRTALDDRPADWPDLPAPQRLERAAEALERAGFPLVDASPRGRVT